MKNLLFCLLASFSSALAKDYPQHYFRNPLNIPILLAGNFGECRPGHFHSGIDIKTEGRENLPVFAAAEGYISRVKMDPGGFGHAIYITHPNGYTSLYAHLNNFMASLQQLVHKTQYKNKSWTLDLSFKPDQFPVKKGQMIAYSGNTGGSTAPHLHFEIRDSKTEHPLNPQLFGFEMTDNVAPTPSALALYDARLSSYNQEVLKLKLKKKGADFMPETDTITVQTNEVNIGLAVNDFMNNSTNTLSIYTAEWFAQDSLKGRLVLDDIGYEETRYLNACADYKLKKESGTWYNLLFLLPNNQLQKIYQLADNNRGSILLQAENATAVRIVLKDVKGNLSQVRFYLKQGAVETPKNCMNWQAGKTITETQPNFVFSLSPKSLYDDFCAEIDVIDSFKKQSISSIYAIANATVPLHDFIPISIKPTKMVPFAQIEKVALVYSDGNSETGKATQFKEGWYSAQVRAFGQYWLQIDTTAPTIVALHPSAKPLANKRIIRFIVKDETTDIKSFSATLNGQWLCFEQHGDQWFYVLDEYCPKGKNRLLLTATDANGNQKNMDYYLVR